MKKIILNKKIEKEYKEIIQKILKKENKMKGEFYGRKCFNFR
mgnify:FL=1